MDQPLIPEPTRADPATVFSALAEILYSASDPSEVYTAICVAATVLIPGCDHASVMLRQGKKYITVAATSEVAARIDDLERQLGQGPCVDAIDEQIPQIEADLRAGSDWPQLAEAMLADTPVRGVMAFRLLIDRTKVGALNLFSTTAGAFTTAAAGQASVLAAFASVTATAVSREQDIASLRTGLANNREIGTAVGLLMALENLSAEEAFDVLRRTSQQMNLKVADLARSLLDRHRSTPGS
ncbi:GAF and ANTAR domain-containing protein [Rhodococcus sp. B50]|uniref:GAF and ANTAR domain-containing protein n=1 Tax=Rhodococcus sp. B50 TaxID=2682847 RepID=UPI0027DE1CA9|nr:GAF and ANTAR domain-containing protein [Rhodococcus sp. B50]MBS9376650.1 hypothetical protein [Rhodococcus sp. B50]